MVAAVTRLHELRCLPGTALWKAAMAGMCSFGAVLQAHEVLPAEHAYSGGSP